MLGTPEVEEMVSGWSEVEVAHGMAFFFVVPSSSTFSVVVGLRFLLLSPDGIEGQTIVEE